MDLNPEDVLELWETDAMKVGPAQTSAPTFGSKSLRREEEALTRSHA
jgi:hypothetical protein